ncbi:hypothetical protein CC79DRAFT_1318222 [Sarocladium strictum]
MTSMSPPNPAVGLTEGPTSAGSISPQQPSAPKNVAFELLFLDSPQYRARLPMRVRIFPHDTTDSIVTTVKNFYGLYSGPTGSKGVSFEDDQGNTLIARYENFRDDMTVYIRVIEESPAPPASYSTHTFHPVPVEGQPCYEVDPYGPRPGLQQSPDITRPDSRLSRRRSPSPNALDGRSHSASGSGKHGHSTSARTGPSLHAGHADAYSDSLNGYSSGDGAPGSSSSRSRDHLGNTDISVENIVEGGRRKRAKFESSELPLFAPPQMPAATSNPSVSPARRIEHHRPSLPFPQAAQNPFTHPRPMQSPQQYTHNLTQGGMYTTPAPDSRRSRGSISYGSGMINGMGILPTPDPTVGSCMSEEDKDVALQLMRLGEMSNISHGRTSASTLDDTFSGRADAASSTGATSDGDSEDDNDFPAARRQKIDTSGTARPIFQTHDAHFMPPPHSAAIKSEDVEFSAELDAKKSKPKSSIKSKSHVPVPRPAGSKPVKAAKPPGAAKVKKPALATDVPMSPASITASRKHSIASSGQMSQLGDDDHPDLSSKPRCQRCRKSKKGCDRQRPCGRCKDAGLSAEQCISEDEGNGRKGRYGRHMGVPIKKDDVPVVQPGLLPAAPIAVAVPMMGAPAPLLDKSKKRKR